MNKARRIEAITNTNWILWYAALTTATSGQVIAISGNERLRIVGGTAVTVLGIGAAVYAGAALDPQARWTASCMVASTTGTVAIGALKANRGQLGATCVAAGLIALMASFVAAGVRQAQSLS